MLTAIQENNAILGLLHKAMQRLEGAGIASYQCDAEILFMSVLEVDRIGLYAAGLSASEGQKSRFENLIEKRARRMPLQYITGKAEFFGLTFFVKPGVFIPRPETEILVEEALDILSRRPAAVGCCLLDLCTGPGNIAISLAKYANCDRIVAVDVSAEAVETAKKNAVLNGAGSKIEFKQAGLFDGLIERFDAIICNPPYIKRQDLRALPAEVGYEPLEALDAGADGLDFYRRIIAEAPKFLKRGGTLVMEMGDTQAEEVKRLVKAEGVFEDIKIVRDLNGIERVLTATCPRTSPAKRRNGAGLRGI